MSELGGMESQGITKTGQRVLTRLVESIDLVPAYSGLVGWEESSIKERWCLLVLLSLQRVALTLAPPALTLKFVNLIPPYISLVFFDLLPLCLRLG